MARACLVQFEGLEPVEHTWMLVRTKRSDGKDEFRKAYAELGFDGYEPPSILQAEGAKDVAVELYSMTKSFSMAGWRSAFMLSSGTLV